MPRVEIVTPPASEPIATATARAHLRLGDDTSQDDAVDRCIAAARERVEAKLGRALVEQTIDVFLDRFPSGGGYLLRSVRDCGWDHPRFLPGPVAVTIPRPPLQSVSWVKYLDESGTLRTLDPSAYRVLPSTFMPGRIEPSLSAATWPATAPLLDAVTIRCVCGYGDPSDVPAAITAAILLIVGHLFEHREEVVDGPLPAQLDRGVDALLAVHAWGRYS